MGQLSVATATTVHVYALVFEVREFFPKFVAGTEHRDGADIDGTEIEMFTSCFKRLDCFSAKEVLRREWATADRKEARSRATVSDSRVLVELPIILLTM